jgi:hypothetical protein
LNTSWNASGLDAALVEENPTLAYDSYLTIGASESGQLHPNSVPWTAPDPRDEFEPGVGMNIEASGTGTFYTLNLSNDDNHPAYAGDDSQVLVLQLTTEGDIYGTMSCLIWPGGNTGNQFSVTLDFDSNSLCNNLDPCVGETDECGVCAGPGAIYECGCTEIPEGDCDCDGNQIDALGVCGGSLARRTWTWMACATMQKSWAATMRRLATTIHCRQKTMGSCTFAADFYDCAGVCLSDADGDGVCDELEVAGCTDAMSCNYNPAATEEDGSCTSQRSSSTAMATA